MDFYVITFFVTHTSTYSIGEFSFCNRRLKYRQNLQFFLFFIYFILFISLLSYIQILQKIVSSFSYYQIITLLFTAHPSIFLRLPRNFRTSGIQNFIFLLFSSFDFVSFSGFSYPISFVSSELKTSESRIQRMRPRNLTKHKRKPLRMEIESGGRGVRVSISSKDSKNSILERKDESTAGLLGQKIVAA